MTIFISYEVYLIFSRKHSTVSVKYIHNNLIDDPGELKPGEVGFDLAIGFSTANQTLLDNSPNSSTQRALDGQLLAGLDPSYGTIKAVFYTFDSTSD